MISDVIGRLTRGVSLDLEEARQTAAALLDGEVGDAEIAGLLVALKMKGETPEEIAGFALGLLDRVEGISPGVAPLVDTCGTGGDGKGTFNISTASAFIAAGAGAYVAKHGNRSISSRCGSADVLEALGVDITLRPERVRECIEKVGIGFLFAPSFHPAMKRLMGPRKALGFPTIFNLLGPLANPAGAPSQVIGVNREDLVGKFGEVLARLGKERAFVLHGLDGTDEFTLAADTLVCEVSGGSGKRYILSPEDLGLARCKPEELAGGDAAANAARVRDLLSVDDGPARDVCVANAAFALVAAGVAEDLMEGVFLAGEAVRSGEALERLEGLVSFTCCEEGFDVSG